MKSYDGKPCPRCGNTRKTKNGYDWNCAGCGYCFEEMNERP